MKKLVALLFLASLSNYATLSLYFSSALNHSKVMKSTADFFRNFFVSPSYCVPCGTARENFSLFTKVNTTLR